MRGGLRRGRPTLPILLRVCAASGQESGASISGLGAREVLCDEVLRQHESSRGLFMGWGGMVGFVG